MGLPSDCCSSLYNTHCAVLLPFINPRLGREAGREEGEGEGGEGCMGNAGLGED